MFSSTLAKLHSSEACSWHGFLWTMPSCDVDIAHHSLHWKHKKNDEWMNVWQLNWCLFQFLGQNYCKATYSAETDKTSNRLANLQNKLILSCLILKGKCSNALVTASHVSGCVLFSQRSIIKNKISLLFGTKKAIWRCDFILLFFHLCCFTIIGTKIQETGIYSQFKMYNPPILEITFLIGTALFLRCWWSDQREVWGPV